MEHLYETEFVKVVGDPAESRMVVELDDDGEFCACNQVVDGDFESTIPIRSFSTLEDAVEFCNREHKDEARGTATP